MSKEECNKWLNEAEISTQGFKGELNNRISKFKRYPRLVEKLKTRAQKTYQFICSLNPNDIPDNSRAWKNEPVLYHKVTEEQLQKYSRNKIEGTLVRATKQSLPNAVLQENCECKSFEGRTRCK